MDKREQQIGQIARATMPVTLAASSDGKGTVEAIVSAYGVEYRIGYFGRHQIEPGAFADSLASQVPLFWEHDWQYGGYPIGDGAGSEIDEGLKIAGGLYIDDSAVQRIHKAMLAGAIREWSIGYRVLEARYPKDKPELTIVTKAELLEASVVVRGANPETETLKVASRSDSALDAAAVEEIVERVLATRQLNVEAPPAPEPVALAADVDVLLERAEYRELIRQDLQGV